MTIAREELAAFADGELPEARAAEVAAAVEADPALAREVEAHRALKARLSGHFAPMLDEPVPDRLATMLQAGEAPPQAEVADLAAARERRRERRAVPRWGWVVGPALAASLALVVFLPRGEQDPAYAGASLAAALDSTLIAEQAPDADTRILLSFRDAQGEFCRAFSRTQGSGIACRDEQGWRIEAQGEGSARAQSEYRMAGADEASILARAQEMAQGPALDAEAEAAARAAGWR